MARPGAAGLARRCSARRTGTSSPRIPSTGLAAPAAPSTRRSSGCFTTGDDRAPADPGCRHRARDASAPATPSFAAPPTRTASRSHNAVTAEWRGSNGALTGDVAVRRDVFNRFKDATSLRASLLGGHRRAAFALAGSYAEGIAQPTFFDLYGFFPNNFVGNPSLKPESSRGFEGSLRFRRRDSSRPRSPPTGSGFTTRSSTSSIPSPSCRAPRTATGPAGAGASRANSPGSRCESLRLSRQLRLSEVDPARQRQPTASSRNGAVPGIAARSPPTALGRAGATARRSPMSGPHLDRRKSSRSRSSGSIPIGWPQRASLMRSDPGIELFARGSNLLDAALRGFGRLPHRGPRPVRRNQAGGSAIIAVKLASAASLPSTLARPANLHTRDRFWTNSTSSRRRHAGLDRRAELGAVDGHEIDQLARVRRGRGSRPRARRRPAPALRRSALRA